MKRLAPLLYAIVLSLSLLALPALAQYCVEYDFEAGLDGWSSDHGASVVDGDLYLDAGDYSEIDFSGYVSGQPNQIEFWTRGGGGAAPVFTLYCGETIISGPHSLGYYVVGVDFAYSTYSPSSACGSTPVIRVSNGAVFAHFEDIHVSPYGCSGAPTPTPSPTATPTPETCDAVDNFSFNDTSAWSLYFSAAITQSAAALPDNGIIAQGIPNLESNTTYNLTIALTNTSTITTVNALTTTLGSSPATLAITNTQTTYTAIVNTGSVAGPQNLSVVNGGPDTIFIDWLCLSKAATGSGGTGQCIAPSNGTFDTSAAGWDLLRGAAYNSAGQAIYLPFSGAGESESGASISQASYSLPTPGSGEYLVYQYTARAIQDTGLTMVGAWTPDQASEFYSYVEVYPQDYTYQFDISSLAGQTVELGINNPGFDPLTGTTKEGDVIVDNICILLSTTPPQLPSPTNPTQYTPVNLGAWYNCSDVDSMVWNYVGVDLRYHRLNYEAGASVWDPNGWVPWLISAMWVILNTIICFLLMLIQTIINLIEYLINNIVNMFTWVLNNWDQIPALLVAWLLVGLDSFANFAQITWQSAKNIAEWFGLSLLEFASSIPEMVANMGTLADWIGAAFIWLWAAIVSFGAWLAANGWNIIIWLFNNMGGVLLLMLIALGGPFGVILSAVYNIWNGLVAILGFIASLLGYSTLSDAVADSLIATFELFSNSFNYLYTYLLDIAAAPQALLTALMNGVQSDSFGLLLGCSGDGSFWCGFLAGLDIVNISYGQSVFYPIVIVAISLGTIYVIKHNLVELWKTVLEDVFKI